MSERSEIAALKKALRREVLCEAASLTPAYKKQADEAIIRCLTALPEYREAGTVFCFVGTDQEIKTWPFLLSALADGKTVAVPLCTGKGIMEARQILSKEDLMPGAYGILEPKPACPLVEPSQIDLAVIPCVSCTHDGRRLGHGGGYYDRYFCDAVTSTAVLICREQLVREAIPTEAHDIRFPLVITDAGIFRNGACLR